MSYCRWSTDDFLCDLYIYESERGYEVHVASSKRVYKDPLPPSIPFTADTIREFLKRDEKVMAMEHELVDIGLPYDGQSFTFEDAEDCTAFLEELRSVGYRFPDYVIDDILETEES